MEKDEAVQRVCAGYCSFYKPGKAEELACKGFLVAQRLMVQVRDILQGKEQCNPDNEAENTLFQIICRDCPFFVRDCDFAAWKRGESPGLFRKDVTPCGGLLFLASALDHGSMDIQAINRVI